MKYLFFDLDGTLCESKQLVEPKMLCELERLNERFKVVIISGAELIRMKTQAPLSYVVYMAQNGNQAFDERFLWTNELKNKDKILEHINLLAQVMGIKITDDMIDDRGSQISLSFVGHHAPLAEKKKFDPDRKIRIALLEKYPFKGAVIGGTTCIDYIPFTKGENISRYLSLRKIRPYRCLYFGDAFMNYGNDSTVCGIVPTFQVKGPLDTLNFVKYMLW